jgi:hypothetical protein
MSSKQHYANLTNLGVVYIDSQHPARTYHIIDDINIVIDFNGLTVLKSDITKIRIVLN